METFYCLIWFNINTVYHSDRDNILYETKIDSISHRVDFRELLLKGNLQLNNLEALLALFLQLRAQTNSIEKERI